MKEKELRLALVVFGGVSLAVYMHGVTKEIQKLLRASKLLHQIRDDRQRQTASYDAVNDDLARETDSERLYFELLRRIGETVSLRVLVDIIAGASAGGINGIMLARAIAEDLPLDPLRHLWLKNADVERLLDPDAASTRWSKIYMRPLVWLYGRWQAARVDALVGRGASAELRRKLSLFVRSRWFAPPFSGLSLTRYLYEALKAMGTGRADGARSLLPPNLPLDLFVTVTDLHGHAERIRIHSPPEITEREHRLVISFRDAGLPGEGPRQIGSLASLTFAARATSSFPGAFPPARLTDIDKVVAEAGDSWADRGQFIHAALGRAAQEQDNIENAAFIDGSVLNNKPFGEAIAALQARPAHREVDRRIVYIEPKPSARRAPDLVRNDRFFSVLRASLSDIPRNQPIRDDLDWVDAFSRRVRKFRHISDEMRGIIEDSIESAIGNRLETAALTAATLTQWRVISHELAEKQAGFAYWAYADMKIVSVLEDCALLLTDPLDNRPSTGLIEQLMSWARRRKILPLVRPRSGEPVGEATPWVDFLLSHDLGYRIRRLRYVIRSLNNLYGAARDVDEHRALDQLKQSLYQTLAPLLRNRSRVECRRDLDPLALDGADPATVDQCMRTLAGRNALAACDAAIDEVLAAGLNSLDSASMRRALVLSYVGFTFVDVASLPMLQGEGLDEFDEIKVDRLSPQDANSIREGDAGTTLKGIELGSFGAFFSGAYRENDYLWGRLHAADRLVDIVLASVTDQTDFAVADIRLLKRRLFESILTAEESHLRNVPGLIDQIRREVDARLG